MTQEQAGAADEAPAGMQDERRDQPGAAEAPAGMQDERRDQPGAAEAPAGMQDERRDQPGAAEAPAGMQDERRDEGRQYALPLVIRVERAAPPGRTDALEGAARAVLLFLTDPRVAEPDGEWAAAAQAWQDARIRKVVRRARGAAWERVAALPGISTTRGSAEIRVFPPVPTDDWPADLARLQVSGTDFDDQEPPGAPGPGTPVLWLNPALPMTAGKSMAQAGHAAQLAWWGLAAGDRAEWAARGFDLAVRTAVPAQWAQLLTSGLPLVTDGGFTEVAPGSATVVADHPALRAALSR